MGEKKVDISVVIPTRDVGALLRNQLASLALQDYVGSWEVVIADNGSTDDTVEIAMNAARNLPMPVRVVHATHARGANVARNAGARVARGNVLLFCDGDDETSPQWVRTMGGALEAADIVGGTLDFGRLNAPRAMAWSFRVPSAIQEYRGFRYALSANLGLRATLFEELNGFDESFRGGFDEVEFGYRAARADCVLREASGAIVHYRLRPTRRTLFRQRFRYGVTSRQFLAKYPELHDPKIDPLRRQLRTVLAQTLRVGMYAFGPRTTRDGYIATLAYEVGVLTALIGEKSHRPAN